jgi:hypothetical protein
MGEKTNTLELYCKFRGWQGGTIYQAVRDYKSLPLEQKHGFCLRLIRVFLDITDPGVAGWFITTLESEAYMALDRRK